MENEIKPAQILFKINKSLIELKKLENEVENNIPNNNIEGEDFTNQNINNQLNITIDIGNNMKLILQNPKLFGEFIKKLEEKTPNLAKKYTQTIEHINKTLNTKTGFFGHKIIEELETSKKQKQNPTPKILNKFRQIVAALTGFIIISTSIAQAASNYDTSINSNISKQQIKTEQMNTNALENQLDNEINNLDTESIEDAKKLKEEYNLKKNNDETKEAKNNHNELNSSEDILQSKIKFKSGAEITLEDFTTKYLLGKAKMFGLEDDLNKLYQQVNSDYNTFIASVKHLNKIAYKQTIKKSNCTSEEIQRELLPKFKELLKQFLIQQQVAQK